MQPAQFFVQINQPGRYPGKPALALIGGIGNFNGVGDCCEERLKALLGLALFGLSIEFLFRVNNLLFWFT